MYARLWATAAVSIILFFIAPYHEVLAQPGSDELVIYEKESAFIKEFPVPFDESGLRGIVADRDGNVWFYHSTNRTSTMVMLDPSMGEFTKYEVMGETVADDPIINLASAQLVFDDKRNAAWFTDARTNSVGMLDIKSGEIDLWAIPTMMAGPMGIALSPDGKEVWFAEITGDNIAKLDVESKDITEYFTGDDSGPALLAFDSRGQLWVSLSFSNNILMAQPWAIAPGSSLGMTKFSLPQPDQFSPFGIAVTGGKVFLSDHGSSRLIVADENSGLQNYESYWTSPSRTYPTTLPSQVVADDEGNVYFAQHGGNRISGITPEGVMTEYEVPTGPLSTVVFLSVSDEGGVWFTEWAANKVAYLDTSVQVPFTLDVETNAVTLDKSGQQSLTVSISSPNAVASPVSLSEVEVGLTGMTESGLAGVAYEAQPPRVDLQDGGSAESKVQIRVLEGARPGSYVAMARVSAPENDGLIVSRLYPIELVLDVPEPAPSQDDVTGPQQTTDSGTKDALRIAAPIGAAGVIAFWIYRWRKAKRRAG